MSSHRRMTRERKTIGVMIDMFCRGRHKSKEVLCSECRDLSEYAAKRLDKCPFGDEKPTCARCTSHCYKPEMRQKVREVMRYSGPRMVYLHPIMAFHHLRDERHKPKGDIKK